MRLFVALAAARRGEEHVSMLAFVLHVAHYAVGVLYLYPADSKLVTVVCYFILCVLTVNYMIRTLAEFFCRWLRFESR